MEWQYLGKQSYSRVANSVEFTRSLSRNVIAIDVDSIQKKDTWNKAGDIVQVLPVLGFPTGLDVGDSFAQIGFAPTLVRFNVLSGNSYKIRFKPVPWLTDFSISIWQYYGY
jgi:hypothetical protein